MQNIVGLEIMFVAFCKVPAEKSCSYMFETASSEYIHILSDMYFLMKIRSFCSSNRNYPSNDLAEIEYSLGNDVAQMYLFCFILSGPK